MKIACIGGGPAGLYASILLKRADPDTDVVIYERNRVDDPFGFGVVFSDATGDNLASADPETFAEMNARFARWDNIDIHYKGDVLTTGGHGFSGLSRRALLDILSRRARSLGVEIVAGCEIHDETELDADLIIASDGAASTLRQRFASHFGPAVDVRPNRFVWLGTALPFPAFTFYFKYDSHGLWRVHAYQYEGGQSTFIVEATEATWRSAGMDAATESDTIAFCEQLFAEELEGHKLQSNRSIWRQFGTVRNRTWHLSEERDGKPLNVVLLGDAAHTVHFSIGSGTKVAMEDAIALVSAVMATPCDIPAALVAYETERRPVVDSLQRAAQISLQWFEETERYMEQHPLQFAFSLLTRSMRVTHANLKVRDPGFVARVDRWFAEEAAAQAGVEMPSQTPPPLFTPYRVRDLVLDNRVVVSPMCQYSAEDGTPNDWHLVHIGSRAVGGAGLIMAEMTNVSAEGRISPGCTGLYLPEHVGAWRRIVDFVHANSSSKIGIQLGHAGRKASTKRMWEGDSQPLDDGGWDTLSASALPYFPHSPPPREITPREMTRIIGEYVRATGMAEAAGFDWLELHAAHGYLLASFISPLTNQRTDSYGGSLDNRMRFPLAVFDAIRTTWPKGRPMSVRISAVDWADGGVDSGEAVAIAHHFKDHGVDAIDVSAGQTVPDQMPVYGRLYQTPFSDRIRHEAAVPTMAVGNISSYTDVDTILASGRADLCLLARAHLWDPYWTRHAAHEEGYPLTWPDQYSTLKRYTPRFL
ncbi:MAG: bifunctional salicylyl-CoA 5-hydroxylase/oxidoreductase [Longimicrobiales bacterium]